MKKVKSRILKIRNFKNIGVSKEDNKYQELYLDSYLDDKIVGNLIILIGENNIGKTNILNALNLIARTGKENWQKLSLSLRNNKPNYIDYYDSSNEIKLTYKENDKEKYSYGISLKNEKFSIINEFPKNFNKIDIADKIDTVDIIKNRLKNLLDKYIPLSKKLPKDEEESKRFLSYFSRLQTKIDEINDFERLNKLYDKLKKTIQRFISHYNKRNNSKIEDKFIEFNNNKVEIIDFGKNQIKNDIKKLLDKYISISHNSLADEEGVKFLNYFNRLQTKIDEINDFERLNKLYDKLKKTIQRFISYYNKRNDNKIEEKFIDIKEIEEVELNTENIILKIPKIIFHNGHRYRKNIQILKSEIDGEKLNFFTYLLKYMENGIENIKKAYSNTTTSKDIYENSINEFLKDGFSRKFNELSCKIFGNYEYDFRIKFEGGLIRLSIKKDNEPITLSQQSQGFQWFFGLFFYLYFRCDLQAGDIILIDEPDAHLSIPSVKGLRNIIKKIAKEMGVTFVTTTHNPFFVDIDYFDEIRIVKKKKEGDGVEIVNFGDIDTHTEADTLKEIIDAFGLGNLNRDIITNPDNKVIFVEGITDYNYLTAFKLLYNQGKNDNEKLNLSFLPIAGLGQNEEESENKIKILSKFKDVIQLTDEDEKANRFKEKMKVIKLTEINENFKEIEDLFSENDKEKFKYIIKNKSFEISSLFKNIIFDLEKELEEETINNFNEVLKRLDEISQNLSDL